MRQTGAAERTGGDELVVRRDQRRGRVQHPNARGRERRESPEAVLRLTPSQLLLRVFRHQSCGITGDEDAVARFEKVLRTV